MYPRQHIIFGFIFSLILFLIFPQIKFVGFSFIFISSFLIDIDHYLSYAFKKRDLNPIRAIKWNFLADKKFFSLSRKKRNETFISICFFHGAEVLLLLFLLNIFVSDLFLFILIGFSFHLFLDIVNDRLYVDRLDRLSIIYDFLKFKKLKNIENII